MKTKKSLMYLECINENLNTLILNQEMTYFIIQEILKKMDRSVNKRHVKAVSYTHLSARSLICLVRLPGSTEKPDALKNAVSPTREKNLSPALRIMWPLP